MMNNYKNGPTWEAVFLSVSADSQLIVGIDEVGRGAWAGPVVASAVILPIGCQFIGINDSKLVSSTLRANLDGEIREAALGIGVGWVSASEVDSEGLSWAVKQSGIRALTDLGSAYDIILLDGKSNYLFPEYNSLAFVKADGLMMPVAAASIVAKVARDNWMTRLAQHYPEFGFEKHKGYGTEMHRRVIRTQGVTPEHRLSYGPLKSYR
jgi:ribonuclease HII